MSAVVRISRVLFLSVTGHPPARMSRGANMYRWLLENVGNQRMDIRRPVGEDEWDYHIEDPVHMDFHFGNERKALLFKLRWGGVW